MCLTKHFIRLNRTGYIIHGFTDFYEKPRPTDLFLHEENYNKFRFANYRFEGNFLINPVFFDRNGYPQYKFVDGEVCEVNLELELAKKKLYRTISNNFEDMEMKINFKHQFHF